MSQGALSATRYHVTEESGKGARIRVRGKGCMSQIINFAAIEFRGEGGDDED
jgi:hypothetical protein